MLRIESIHARPQLSVLVPELPVRLGEPFETFGEAACFGERCNRREDRYRGDEPLESQQISYLTERLATVSTA